MSRTDRRTFLGATAAAAGAAWLQSRVEPLHAAVAEPKTLQLGVIGVGWYGMVDAQAALKVGNVEIAAVCDVDSDHLQQAASQLEKEQGRRPQTFKLYDELLALKSLDAVIIATPPQWHALQLIAALKAGKHVYCEKPLAYDVREGQAMVTAVEKSDRIVEVGFQRRQSAALKQATDLVKSGTLGDLVQVDAQIHYRAGLEDPTPQSPPASLDWPLWCGPGPLIPYSPQVGHKSWRLEHTSGHGHLVDWGIHLIDATRSFLGLEMPKRITAAGGLFALQGRITTPDTLSVHLEFDQVPVHWRHRIWGATEVVPELSNGIFFFCREGTVFATDHDWFVLRSDGQKVEHHVDADLGTLHMADFLEAVRANRQPLCQMRDAFKSTATVQLAMISYETGTTVQWDSQTLEIVDNPTASALLQRTYRAPWQHPYAQQS